MKNNTLHIKQQQGAVLFVSLILLLIMTLIGITGMQTTVLEEKMSGHFRNKNIAFQAAESALKSGERYVQNTSPLPIFNGVTLGLYQPTTGTLFRWEEPIVVWTDTANDVVADPVAQANPAQQPAYIVEELPEPPKGVGQSLASGKGLSISTVEIFRVTSKGVGGTATSSAMLQSVYKK